VLLNNEGERYTSSVFLLFFVYIVCSLSASLPGLANKDVHKQFVELVIYNMMTVAFYSSCNILAVPLSQLYEAWILLATSESAGNNSTVDCFTGLLCKIVEVSFLSCFMRCNY